MFFLWTWFSGILTRLTATVLKFIFNVHSKLENCEGRVFLKQWEPEATVFVNGQLLIGEITLNHGDRVIFGGGHYFRFIPS